MRWRRPWVLDAWAIAGITGLATLKLWALVTPIRSSRLYLGGDFGLSVEGYFYHQLKRGVLPLWDPTLGTGSPFFGSGTHHPMFLQAHLHLFYPVNLLWLGLAERGQFISHVVLQYHHALHFALAGAFTYGYGRQLGLARVPALVAGVAFMLSGFLLGHIYHWTLVDTIVWLPAILACLLRADQTGQLRWGVLAGVALACAFLAGHPQIFYYVGLATVALAVTLGARRAAVGRPVLPLAASAALAAVIAVGLSAIQLVPSWELTVGSHRAALGYDWKSLGSLEPAFLVQLLMPWALRRVPGWAAAASEYFLYPGIPTLALGGYALARRWDWRVGFHGVLALAALVLAFGDHYGAFRAAYDLLPGIRLFRIPARAFGLVSFGLAILAGLGADALLRGEGADRFVAALRRLALIAAAGLLAVPLILVSARGDRNADDLEALAGQYVLLVLVLLAVTVVAGWAHQGARRAAGAGLLGVLVLDLLFGSYPVTDTTRNPDVRPARERAWVAALRETPEPVRLSRGHRIHPQQIYRHGWGVFDGESTFAPPAFLDLYALSREHPHLVDLLNVRYFVTKDTAPPHLPVRSGPLQVYPGAIRRLAVPPGPPGRQLELDSHLSYALDVAAGEPVATLHLVGADGRVAAVPLRAGVETAEWSLASPDVRGAHPAPAARRPWPAGGGAPGQSYRATIPVPPGMVPAELVFEGGRTRAALTVEAVRIDDRPVPLAAEEGERFRLVVPALYENHRAFPRAFLVRRARQVAPDEVLDRLKSLDPAEEVLVTDPVPADWATSRIGPAAPRPPVRVVEYAPHRVRLEVEIAEPHVLVLSDTYDPRWRAWDNGRPVPVLRANHALRAVLLSPGRHVVEFRYRQPSAILALAVTLATLAGLAVAGVLAARGRRTSARHAPHHDGPAGPPCYNAATCRSSAPSGSPSSSPSTTSG